MKRKRFSEERIIEILRLHQAGAKQAGMAGCRCRTPSGFDHLKTGTAS
jgi:hypothetical protein